MKHLYYYLTRQGALYNYASPTLLLKAGNPVGEQRLNSLSRFTAGSPLSSVLLS